MTLDYEILVGNNQDTLKTLDDCSVDSIVTDPPYGINFLNHKWDSNTGAVETYIECLRVLKPGGYILAFSAPKTYHHLAIALEQAGFEIRDQIMWICSQTMPKGNNLKPAHEPICLAAKHKAKPLNIDDCRTPRASMTYPSDGIKRLSFNQPTKEKWQGGTTTNDKGGYPHNVLGTIKGYEKYFYAPKATAQERGAYNTHPTVKPVDLMRWLIRLVTPPNGVVLDPFCGSGTTGMAAVELGHSFIGCELDPNYAEISRKRIQEWNSLDNKFGELFEFK